MMYVTEETSDKRYYVKLRDKGEGGADLRYDV